MLDLLWPVTDYEKNMTTLLLIDLNAFHKGSYGRWILVSILQNSDIYHI